ncbi:hypothetical protein ZOSMA_46G00730 [Zostera marina]|uniref:Uncharacterized protein n=1 Tax=Zostera marina TaxID=29655 RepID=A0A0K9P2B3_ZOSMR|nr:hypothetical protein ZOSMA_46G00730 [Zostera marina]
MQNSPAAFTFLLSLFFCSLVSSTGVVVDPKKTVYEILPTFGLPAGLLPDSVVSYSLSKDGSFVVELVAPCHVQFDYLVYYDKTISGTLKLGGIFDLEGVQVKKLLFWFDVDSIQVDLPPTDSIYFEIGWISKTLDVDQFKTVRSCGDGVGLCGNNTGFWKIPEPLIDEVSQLLTE